MAISEKDRLKLYDRLGETLGSDHAGTMMELLPPTGWDDIATKGDLQITNEQVRVTNENLRATEARLLGEIAKLGGDLRMEMATNLRIMVLAQITTTLVLLGFMLART